MGKMHRVAVRFVGDDYYSVARISARTAIALRRFGMLVSDAHYISTAPQEQGRWELEATVEMESRE